MIAYWLVLTKGKQVISYPSTLFNNFCRFCTDFIEIANS